MSLDHLFCMGPEWLTLGLPNFAEKFSSKTKLVSINNPNHELQTCKYDSSVLMFGNGFIFGVFKSGLTLLLAFCSFSFFSWSVVRAQGS